MSIIYFNAWPRAASIKRPTPISRKFVLGGSGKGAYPLPTDSIGNYNLNITNIVVGSICEIEIASTGAQVSVQIASSSTVNFLVPAYSTGSYLNDLRIKVRKASSSPYYQPYETQASAIIGTQSIFVNQVRDDI